MKPKVLFCLLLFSFFPIWKSAAQNYSVSLKASTLGVSLEGVRSFGDQFNARAGLSYFSININGGGGNNDYVYNGKLKLFTFSALADWFPFKSFYRVTGGFFVNLNKGDLTLTSTSSHTIGSTVYTPEILGNVIANVTVNKITPYLGLGIGNLNTDQGFGFSFDIGALYHGAPNVSLSASGLLQPSAEQAPVIEDNLKWFKFYPVLAVGIIYNF
jgi:hypothetical protein